MAYQVGGSRIVDNSGNIDAGITTGTFFYGDGSNLTNINGAEITPGTTVERLVAGANISINPPTGQGVVTITGIGGGGGGSGSGAGILQMDDISGSFNGSTLNFNITIAGLPPNPAPTTQQVIISVGGVVQTPGSSYVVGLAGTLPQVQFIGQAPPAGVSFAGYVISYQYATTSSPGVVQPDNLTVGVGNSGVITALTATVSTKGVVQPDGVSIQIDGNGVISSSGVPSGSVLPFYQAAAPSGWTRLTSAALNDAAIRLVTTSGGTTGGSSAFSGVFASRTVPLPFHSHGVSDPGHSHGISDPGHDHDYRRPIGNRNVQNGSGETVRDQNADFTSSSSTTGISIFGSGTNISINGAGTGDTMDFAVKYANFILCQKN